MAAPISTWTDYIQATPDDRRAIANRWRAVGTDHSHPDSEAAWARWSSFISLGMHAAIDWPAKAQPFDVGELQHDYEPSGMEGISNADLGD